MIQSLENREAKRIRVNRENMTSKNPKMSQLKSKNQNSASFKLFEIDLRRYFNTYNLLLVSESKYYMLEVQLDREFPAKTPNKTILISNIEIDIQPKHQK